MPRAPLALAIAVLPALVPAPRRGAADAERATREYLAALDAGEVERALALHASGARLVVDGEVVAGEDAARDYLEWESALGARRSVAELDAGPDAGGERASVRFAQTDLLQAALGVARERRLELAWRDGRIASVELAEATAGARDWRDALTELERWLAGRPDAPRCLRGGALARSGAAARALLPALAEWRELCAASRERNEPIVASYVEALDRHDVDAQHEHFAPDFAFVDGGARFRPNKEEERHDREFEAGNRADWSYSVVRASPDALDLLISESMAFYDALGVGARSHRARYRFRDAAIVEASAWDWTQAGAPYEATRDRFVAWVVAERPEAAARVVRGGGLDFRGPTAAEILALAREWGALARSAAPPARDWVPERAPARWLEAPGVLDSSLRGTSGADWINELVPLRDGGWLALGFVGRDDAAPAPDWDVVALRHRADGALAWARRYGGRGVDAAWSGLEEPDGRILLAGFSGSAGAGDWDAYLAALDPGGELLFERHHGGAAQDRAIGLVPAEDGGSLLVGETRSAGAGERDVLLVRVDAAGAELWRRTHGGPLAERAFTAVPRAGGGCVAIGTSGVEGALDGLVLAFDARGDEVWRRTLDGNRSVIPHHVEALADGRLLVSGYTDSFGADGNDAFVALYTPEGELLRHELLGGAGDDRVMTATATADGGAWLVGYTRSLGAGGWDVLVARLGPDGALEPRALALGGPRDDQGTCVLPLAGGELLLGGYAQPADAPADAPDLLLARIDPRRAQWEADEVAHVRVR